MTDGKEGCCGGQAKEKKEVKIGESAEGSCCNEAKPEAKPEADACSTESSEKKEGGCC